MGLGSVRREGSPVVVQAVPQTVCLWVNVCVCVCVRQIVFFFTALFGNVRHSAFFIIIIYFLLLLLMEGGGKVLLAAVGDGLTTGTNQTLTTSPVSLSRCGGLCLHCGRAGIVVSDGRWRML